jgi:hypothetical protein
MFAILLLMVLLACAAVYSVLLFGGAVKTK